MKCKVLGTALLCSFMTLAYAQAPSGVSATAGADTAPTGVTAARTRGIIYHGGPVMGTSAAHPVHLYFIYYGKWTTTDPSGPAIMSSFGNSLGGSPYWNILTTYKETNGTTIQNAMTLNGTYMDTGSQGSNLSDTTLQTVVKSAIGGGHLPFDPTGIYHVLASPEVNETSGFCSSYCNTLYWLVGEYMVEASCGPNAT